MAVSSAPQRAGRLQLGRQRAKQGWHTAKPTATLSKSCTTAAGLCGETFSPVVSLFTVRKRVPHETAQNSPKSAEIRRRAAARAVNSRRAEAALAENGRKGAGRPCNRVGRPKPSEWVGTIVRTSDERGPLEVSSVALGCAPRCILQWRVFVLPSALD